MLIFSTKIILVAICFTTVHSAENQISPNTVRNDNTNEKYNDVLINPMVDTLANYVAGDRDSSYSYIPDDVGLVQTMMSAQIMMFQLATFYTQHKAGTSLTRYEGGLAIEFESQLCDEAHSSKFPRTRTNTIPWKFYRDSVYYQVNCKLPKVKSSRKRRDTLSVVEGKRRELSRNRRAAPKNSKQECGDTFKYTANKGSIVFPTNQTFNYTSNTHCEWTIEVTPSFTVRADFEELYIEEDKKCFYDSIAFYDGKDSNAPFLDKTCGSRKIRVQTTSYYLTIVFKADASFIGGGFKLVWTIGNGIDRHPGFLLTSTIVVDQVGDLSTDKFNFDTLGYKDEHDDYFDTEFKLKLTDPSTCSLASDNHNCYFESKPSIVSKIIAVGMEPLYELPEYSIEVVFDHVFEVSKYPELYESPKFCLTWDATVKNTEYGSWTRENGRLHDTNMERTICRYQKPGIYSLGAAVPPPIMTVALRFSLSWYCGLLFTCVWIIFTLARLSNARMNIPDWLNINQLISLLVFCCIVLSGMHLELDNVPCSILSFLLYYFGLSVFIWHALKAAQFTGTFDKFFRAERNLYAFYFLLGWGTPFFISGMAGGAELFHREQKQSCWIGMKGGSIVGETAPVYFIVLFIAYIYRKGLKRAKLNDEVYNYPKMVGRMVADSVALVLFVLTWISGLFCVLRETEFAPQFFFCMFLCCTTIMLCLTAKQNRRSLLRDFDHEDHDHGKEKYEKHRKFIEEQSDFEDDLEYEQNLMQKFFFKWMYKGTPDKLDIHLLIPGLDGAVIVQNRCTFYVRDKVVKKSLNDQYANEKSIMYTDNDNDGPKYNDDEMVFNENENENDRSDDDDDKEDDDDDFFDDIGVEDGGDGESDSNHGESDVEKDDGDGDGEDGNYGNDDGNHDDDGDGNVDDEEEEEKEQKEGDAD